MKAIQIQQEDKIRITCPKCKGFLMEVRPFLSKNQYIKVICRKCKTKLEVN